MNFSGESKGPSHSWARPVWVPVEEYLSQHYSHMRTLEGYFVTHDGLSFTSSAGGTIVLSGRIECLYGLALDVNKLLAFDQDTNCVSAIAYKYQAVMTDPPTKIFRYDNAHTYAAEGHPDAYHKHPFNPQTGAQSEAPAQWIGIEKWPTLHVVLDELREWWFEIGQHLTETRIR